MDSYEVVLLSLRAIGLVTAQEIKVSIPLITCFLALEYRPTRLTRCDIEIC